MRGCRDNILHPTAKSTTAVFDQTINQDKKLYVTYIDYSVTVSHKILDTCLKNTGSSHKTLTMFITIYNVTEDTSTVKSMRSG